MSSNKDRLYIALYARGRGPKMPGLEDTYHWALLVGPRKEGDKKRGTKYHAKQKFVEPGDQVWVFEELDISLRAVDMLLVRITVAKIENVDRLRDILRAVPVRQGESGWNCVGWVREAMELLDADSEALGTRVMEWEKVRNTAISYCNGKKAGNRFNGKGAGFDSERPPTFDLMTNKEVIP